MVRVPGVASFMGIATDRVYCLAGDHMSETCLLLCRSSLDTHTVLSPWMCSVSSRPTIRADWSSGATVHFCEAADCNLKCGPSQESNPHFPRTTAVSSPGGRSGRAPAGTKPPFPALAVMGTSRDLVAESICRSRSCAREVPNTRGAPSAASTRPGFCAQRDSEGLMGCRIGVLVGPTGGSATTTTDLGSRNDGGMFRRRFRVSLVGSASAGMYWKWAVCSDDRMRTPSTMAP